MQTFGTQKFIKKIIKKTSNVILCLAAKIDKNLRELFYYGPFQCVDS